LNFGIEEDDNFGCELANNYSIINHQYDCTRKS
jgi:hypothetical protein